MADQEKSTMSEAQPSQEIKTPMDIEKAEVAAQPFDKRSLEANQITEDPATQFIPNRIINKIVLVPLISNPKDYSRSLKIYITLVVAQAAAIDTFLVSIFYPTLPQLPQKLTTTPPIANLAIALPTISTAIFPLYWSYISEQQGRRPTYLLSLTLFITFSALSAISNSIGMLIAMRFLSGVFSSAVTSTGAGVIADIWFVKEKGRAMSAYYVGILMGPTIGPVIGGLLVERWGWRAVEWFLVVWGASALVFMIFALPETLRKISVNSNTPDEQQQIDIPLDNVDVDEREDSNQPNTPKRLRNPIPSIWKKATHAILHPLKITKLLTSPIVLLSIYTASITFLITRMFQISLQQAFSRPPYSFNATEIGLSFLPSACGTIAGNIVAGKWSDHVMHRIAKAEGRCDDRGHVLYATEDRVRENAWFAFGLLPCALVWYGWTVENGVFWLAPMIATFFIGASTGLIFSLVTTIMVELLPHRSASLVALNSLGRNTFAAIGSAIGEPMISAVGYGWAATIPAIVTVIGLVPVLLIKTYGARWREALARRNTV